MTKTTNYQLPKWEKTDRIQMKDFNDMTATLDAALKANADAIRLLNEAMPSDKVLAIRSSAPTLHNGILTSATSISISTRESFYCQN